MLTLKIRMDGHPCTVPVISHFILTKNFLSDLKLYPTASCNNLPMVRFLVESGACLFAQTLSDHETPAEKCEEDEEGFDGCSEYLYSTLNLFIINHFSRDADMSDNFLTHHRYSREARNFERRRGVCGVLVRCPAAR